MWAINRAVSVALDRRPVYEIAQGAGALGIPERRLEGWVERGVLSPGVQAAGPGTRRRFSLFDLVKAAVINRLVEMFGPSLRPGAIAAQLDWKRACPDMVMWGPDGPMFIDYKHGGQLTEKEMLHQLEQYADQYADRPEVCVIIDVAKIAKRVQEGLEDIT